jgi:hypothetical protein
MVLQLSCRSSLFAATGLDCSIKEGVYLRVALGLKSYVHRSGLRLTRFEPEEMATALAKSLQIGVAVFALEIYEFVYVEEAESLPVKEH